MLLHPTEMDIQFVQVLQQGSQRCTLGHLGEGVDVLGEALATVTELAVRTGDIGMSVIDIAGQQHTSVDLTPVSPHLLTILATSIEVGHLIGAKHIMHILGEFCLQRSHHGEFLTHEDLGEQVVGTGEHHGLLAEILDEGALGEELGHIAHLMASLLRESFACAGQDGSAHEHGYIRQVGDEFLHQREVLRTVVLGRHVNLQEGDINTTQVIIIALGRVADEQFALGVVVLQPVFQGSTDEATSNNSNVNHLFVNIFKCYCLFRYGHTDCTDDTDIFKVYCV